MSDTDSIEIEQDISSDEEERADLANSGDVFTEPSDPPIKSLYDEWQDGDLVIQPDFQRLGVWDDKRKSRLIESAVLKIPLPTVYLAEGQDGQRVVIDGQQRLTAFFEFIDGKNSKGKKFNLSGLGKCADLNGLSYSGLGDKHKLLQRRIKQCPIRVITFLKNSDPNLKFEIFQRLNSGAVSLNDQEMRNCVYRGEYNDLLRELSKDADFRFVMGFSGEDKRMRDVEYVLRFAAFYFQTYLKYKAPIKTFLNKEMEEKRDLQGLEKAFKNAVASVRTVFGEEGKSAFRRWLFDRESAMPKVYRDPQKFNAALYDILMWSFAVNDRGAITRNADAIREAMIHLSTANEKFIEHITRATSNMNEVKGRFAIWQETLDEILLHEKKQPRCFSRELKEELFAANPTCKICNQRISDIDDAAVDHIEQYWLGGKTISENARLVHRHCNNTRSRKESEA